MTYTAEHWILGQILAPGIGQIWRGSN